MHVMIDLETAAVGARAPIVEIGACHFNSSAVGARFHVEVDLWDVMLRTGRMPDRDTLGWWRMQDQPKRENVKRLSVALDSFSEWMEGREFHHVWANSPAFDCVILQGHYTEMRLTAPWSYRQELDYRTMRWFSGFARPEEVTHNAMEDAVGQAEALIKAGIDL